MLAFVKILKKFDKVNRLPFKPLLTFWPAYISNGKEFFLVFFFLFYR
jgi:hypothetical protein